MDNKESESEGTSSSHVPTRQPRQRLLLHNNIRRTPVAAPRTSNNAEEQQHASDRPDNRDTYIDSSRNNGNSSSLSTIVNDLSGTHRSNDSSSNLRGNGVRNNSNPTNNNNGAGAPTHGPDNDSATRFVNTSSRNGARRRSSINLRGAGTSRSNISTASRNSNNSVSPMRGTNLRHRAPPLRLRGNSPTRNLDVNSMHSNLSPDSNDAESEFPFSYIRMGGLGTEEYPFMLSPSPNETGQAPAQGEMSPQQTDEEFARQLQQEEWGRSSTPLEGNFFPSHVRHHMLSRAPRRARLAGANSGAGSLLNGSSVRGRPSLNFSYHQGGAANREGHFPASRFQEPNDDGFAEGSGGASNVNPFPRIMRTRAGDRFHPQSQQQNQMAAAELIPFIFDLFHSHGLPDAEVMNMLSPNRPDLTNNYEALLALAEQVGEVNRGMSQTDINKLPTQKHKAEATPGAESGASCGGEEPQCNICLTEYKSGDSKRLMPCKHEFHKDCVDQWLKTNATCPVCRSDIKLKKS